MEIQNFIVKNLIKGFVFLGLFLVSCEVIVLLFPYLPNHDWLRIERRIQASKRQIKSDTLYLGDSVGNQFYSFNGENQLTTNASVYPAGNYFLVRDALENNLHLKSVVYLIVPDALKLDLSNSRTDLYFVKPFYTFKNRKEILNSDETKRVLKTNPYLDLNLFNAYKLLAVNNFDYSKKEIEQEENKLSYNSVFWLKKIDSITRKHNVRFHLVSPPVPNSRKQETSDWASIRRQSDSLQIKHLIDGYLSSIQYWNDDLLKDHIHWKNEVVSDSLLTFRKHVKDITEIGVSN